MNLAVVPLASPVISIDTFPAWEKIYQSSNYRLQINRLSSLERGIKKDPIAYIAYLSKIEHKSDGIIAIELSTYGVQWTPKMVYTLRKQCGIIGNDHRQANAGKLAARPKQDAHVQKIVGYYVQKIKELNSIDMNLKYSLEELLQKLDFHSVDEFFSKMSQESLGERPIKQIIDALYEKHDVSPGKGSRVGFQYIRTKLATCKALVTS